jgi:ferrochelatase
MLESKIAVILLNLGGPNSLEAVKPFLFNLFYDKAIIRILNPFRWLLAKFISSRREKKAKDIYALLGGSSPILKNTEAQAEALKKKLGRGYEVFICMRYWHPMSEEVARKIKEYNPDEIVFLPLYPQYSTTTTGSSVEDLQKALEKHGINAKQRIIESYQTNEYFIKSHVELIEDTLSSLRKDEAIQINNIKILFSAHGLPQKIIDAGDPYQKQVEETVAAVMNSFKTIDHLITYQSRVGPLEWLKPDTEEEIIKAAKEGKIIIVVPIAFVSEHSETLVELDIEYGKIARDLGAQYFRVPALGVEKNFIECLTRLVTN